MCTDTDNISLPNHLHAPAHLRQESAPWLDAVSEGNAADRYPSGDDNDEDNEDNEDNNNNNDDNDNNDEDNNDSFDAEEDQSAPRHPVSTPVSPMSRSLLTNGTRRSGHRHVPRVRATVPSRVPSDDYVAVISHPRLLSVQPPHPQSLELASSDSQLPRPRPDNRFPTTTGAAIAPASSLRSSLPLSPPPPLQRAESAQWPDVGFALRCADSLLSPPRRLPSALEEAELETRSTADAIAIGSRMASAPFPLVDSRSVSNRSDLVSYAVQPSVPNHDQSDLVSSSYLVQPSMPARAQRADSAPWLDEDLKAFRARMLSVPSAVRYRTPQQRDADMGAARYRTPQRDADMGAGVEADTDAIGEQEYGSDTASDGRVEDAGDDATALVDDRTANGDEVDVVGGQKRGSSLAASCARVALTCASPAATATTPPAEARQQLGGPPVPVRHSPSRSSSAVRARKPLPPPLFPPDAETSFSLEKNVISPTPLYSPSSPRLTQGHSVDC